MAIPHDCSLWCSGTMAIRISRRSNTYYARNHWLTSRYLFLPHSNFCFRIMDLGSRFMAFPLSKKSNPAKDCSWDYYRDYLDHISKYHPDLHCYTIVCSVILNGRGSSRSSHYYKSYWTSMVSECASTRGRRGRVHGKIFLRFVAMLDYWLICLVCKSMKIRDCC